MVFSRFIAIAGIILFALAFFTAVKSRFIARITGGIASQHRIHHLLSLFAASFITFHIIYEIMEEPGIFLSFDSLEIPEILAAWLAYVMIALAVMAAFRKSLHHRYWLRIHSLFTISWMLVVYHTILFIQSSPVDIIFAGLVIVTGSSAIIYRMIAGYLARDWIITKNTAIAGDLRELELVPARRQKIRQPEFKAGAIVYLRFHESGFTRQWHPFSVASCRTSPSLHLIIKKLGQDTAKVAELTPGIHVNVLGPYHEFDADPSRDQCWVAGGTGIAPFAGMMHCLDFKAYKKVSLVYFAKEGDEGLSTHEINRFKSFHHEFSWSKFSVPQGQVPVVAELMEALEKLENPQILICGPYPFMRYIRSELGKRGFDKKNIQTEEFTPW